MEHRSRDRCEKVRLCLSSNGSARPRVVSNLLPQNSRDCAVTGAHLHLDFVPGPRPASAGLLISTGPPCRAGLRRVPRCGRAAGWWIDSFANCCSPLGLPHLRNW